MSYRLVGSSPIFAVIAASALWAAGTVLSKKLLISVPPVLFLVVQLAPSAIVLWLVAFATRVHVPKWQVWTPLALLGLLNPGFSYTFSMIGLAHTPASVATVLWATEPGMIVLLARMLLQEPLKLPIGLAIGVAATGVLLVSGVLRPEEQIEISPAALWGNGLILCGVACCALYTVFCRRVATTVDPLFTVTLQQTVGLIWAIAFLAVTDGIVGLNDLSGLEWLGGTVAGLMYYVAAFWLYLLALRRIAASLAGLFLNLIPVFGIGMAYAVLGERLDPIQWLGAALVVSTMLAVLLWYDRQAPIPQE
jgi:drug/metabolite transporter (DMT)-like permease